MHTEMTIYDMNTYTDIQFFYSACIYLDSIVGIHILQMIYISYIHPYTNNEH